MANWALQPASIKVRVLTRTRSTFPPAYNREDLAVIDGVGLVPIGHLSRVFRPVIDGFM